MSWSLPAAAAVMTKAAHYDREHELMRTARELTPGQVQDLRDCLHQVLDALAIADARDA